MRQIMLLAALALAVLVTAADAQDTAPQPPQEQPPQQYQGPIWGGFDHQPTQAEIDQRQRDTKAAQERAREQNQEVDQLYKQLINPSPPCSAPQGCAGQSQ